jgi:hypothetical protein
MEPRPRARVGRIQPAVFCSWVTRRPRPAEGSVSETNNECQIKCELLQLRLRGRSTPGALDGVPGNRRVCEHRLCGALYALHRIGQKLDSLFFGTRLASLFALHAAKTSTARADSTPSLGARYASNCPDRAGSSLNAGQSRAGRCPANMANRSSSFSLSPNGNRFACNSQVAWSARLQHRRTNMTYNFTR